MATRPATCRSWPNRLEAYRREYSNSWCAEVGLTLGYSKIDALPKVLQGMLEQIEEQIGWKSTVLVGGPRPDTGEFAALL